MIRSIALACSIALLGLPSCGKDPVPPPKASTQPSNGTTASATPPPNPLAPQSSAELLPPGAPVDASGTQIEAQGLTFSVPESWVQQPVSNSMRAAQYKVPAPAGSGMQDGEFVVFRGIGGSPEDNLTRWENQMTDLTLPRARGTRTTSGITVDSLVQYGTYNAGAAMSDAGPQPNWGFAGAIITGGPAGAIYLRLTGPREVVNAQLSEWGEVLTSIMNNAPTGMR